LYDAFRRFVDTVNHFHGDSSQNQKVRNVIWEVICKSPHIFHDIVYLWCKGQPSGNPTTAVSNSWLSCIGVRLCYYNIFKTLKDFARYIYIIAYGDDILISVHPKIRHLFNPKTLSDAFKLIGMTFTTEAKGEQTEEFRGIHEVTFLKRAFAYDEDLHYWFAPLDIRSIRESCNWIRKSGSATDATVMNAEDAVVELYQHSRRTFTEYQHKLRNAVEHRTGYRISSFDYDIARRMIALGNHGDLHAHQRVRI